MSESVKLDRKEAIASLLQTIKWYQDSLYDRLSDYQSTRVSYVKMILGLYAVLIPVMTTIITIGGRSVGGKNYDFFSDSASLVIISAILITVGLVSLALLRIIVTSKATAVLAERQVNCNRQAIHAIYLEYFDGIKTEKEEDFDPNRPEIKESDYCKIFGRHRRYPIGNDHLRTKYESFLSTVANTEDGLLAAILSFLTTAIVAMGTFGILYAVGISGFLAGIATTVMSILIILAIIFINYTSMKPVQEALEKKTDICITSSSNGHS